jgi:hypothetical protein
MAAVGGRMLTYADACGDACCRMLTRDGCGWGTHADACGVACCRMLTRDGCSLGTHADVLSRRHADAKSALDGCGWRVLTYADVC